MNWLFGTEGFTARGICSAWSPQMMLWDRLFNFGIFLGYMLLPLLMIAGYRYSVKTIGIKPVFWYLWPLFGLFIFTCGLTHLFLDIETFLPVYRAGIVIEGLCMVATWLTILSAVTVKPRFKILLVPVDYKAE